MKSKTVALEIGHGPTPTGFDPGTIAYGGVITEYDLNKVAALACQIRLRELNIESVLIDDKSSLTTLGERAEGYACFVSIHHNSYDGKVQGVETLIERRTSNAKDRELAEAIQRGSLRSTGSSVSNNDLTNRGVKEQGLSVLQGADSVGAVACLHECYFIDSLNYNLESFKRLSYSCGIRLAESLAFWYRKNIDSNPKETPNSSEYPYLPATLPLINSYLEIVRALQGLGDAPKVSLSSAQFDAAVRTFQTKNSLVVDGFVGPKTLAALELALGLARGIKGTKIEIDTMYLTKTKKYDVNDLCVLELNIAGTVFSIRSGQPNAQNFRLPSDPKSVPGNMEPIPQGKYRVGETEFYEGVGNYDTSSSQAVGPVARAWVAMFDDDRGAFYEHWDKRPGATGSAGCGVHYNIDKLKESLELQEKLGIKYLVVDWDL